MSFLLFHWYEILHMILDMSGHSNPMVGLSSSLLLRSHDLHIDQFSRKCCSGRPAKRPVHLISSLQHVFNLQGPLPLGKSNKPLFGILRS